MLVADSLGSFGKSGSICDSDLAESYNNIAQIIADRGNVFRLSTRAEPGSVKVYVDKAYQDPAAANITFDTAQNAIVFNGKLPPAGSRIDVFFSEAK